MQLLQQAIFSLGPDNLPKLGPFSPAANTLGKMLQERGLKTPTFPDRLGMTDQIGVREADNMAKIDDERILINVGIVSRGKEV